jgi:hypothetical protein
LTDGDAKTKGQHQQRREKKDSKKVIHLGVFADLTFEVGPHFSLQEVDKVLRASLSV